MRVLRWIALVTAFVLSAAVPAATQAAPSAKRPSFVVTGHARQVAIREARNDRSLKWFDDQQVVLDILEPTYYLAEAVDANGSPAFDFGLEATTGQVIAASQIGYDHETGEALMAVGSPTLASLQQLAAGVSDFPAWMLESDMGTGTDTTSAIAAATWQAGRGAFGTFWTDPVGITVSNVITEIRWEYNGTNVRYPVVADVTGVFSPNGWKQVSHTKGAYLNAAKTVATGYSQATHQTSSWFPSPTCGTTKVKYYANSAYGGRTGNISGGVTTWAEGSCRGLLSYTTVVRRGTV